MAKRIETVDLCAYYRSTLAVADVSLTIEPKTITALIGPSGCGKSTYLRALNRMHEVIPGARVTGQVLLDDEDIYAPGAVSYTHLRAHETDSYLVCRLLLEKKKK